jgi:hypothetical protein
MADEPELEDVLELENEVTDEPEAEEQGETDESEGTAATDDDEETFIGFGDEEGSAPDPENESSVIRQLRKQNRELVSKLREIEVSQPEKPKEQLGPKPSLESCEFDEDKFESALDDWKSRKARIEQAEREEQDKREADEKAYQEAITAYEAGKTELAKPDFEDAEAEVKATLDPRVQALLLKSGKGPALIYALGKSPEKLEALSKMNLADAAMMIGEYRAKLTVERRKKAPPPDRPVTGTASGNQSGNLKRLHAEAQRTGDYSAYFAAKRAAQA